MVIFGFTMGEAGLAGAPRRADLANSPYLSEPPDVAQRLGHRRHHPAHQRRPAVRQHHRHAVLLPETGQVKARQSAPRHNASPLFLERWRFWIGVIVVLALLAWGPVIVDALDFPTVGTSALPAHGRANTLICPIYCRRVRKSAPAEHVNGEMPPAQPRKPSFALSAMSIASFSFGLTMLVLSIAYARISPPLPAYRSPSGRLYAASPATAH